MQDYQVKTDAELEAEARKALPNPENSNSLYFRVMIMPDKDSKEVVQSKFVTPPKEHNQIFVIFTRRKLASGFYRWALQRIDR